ncbi:MAG: M1 family aminopeptidase [Flavobacteriales bacterium]
MFKSILFFFLLGFSLSLNAQQYWQQEVHYTIQVRLNDQTHELSGYEVFEYVNHSPNTLDRIYMHLWPNAYRDGNSALAKQLYRQGDGKLTFAKAEDKGYIDSLNFKSEGTPLKWEYDVKNQDICIIYLNTPLKNGDRVRITTPFKVKIPSGEISRMGHIGQSYQITQWYPKPAVYDKNGWNAIPYLNQGEFYSEYGTYDVSITLPKNYVVGATGDLQTKSEVAFLDEQQKLTGEMLGSWIENSDKDKLAAFPESSKEMKTIRYTQSQVHDFAWFADKRYGVLKGEVELPHSKRKVTSWAMFTPQNAKLWQHAIEYINDGTYYYSLWNGDYPYNQVTAVDGTISAGGGMEYPNVTVIGNAGNKEELEVVIVHEVGHNWFYGILGSNERVHGWMDEGMNTLNEMRYMQTKYPNNTRFSDMILKGRFHMEKLSHHDSGDITYSALASLGLDQPIETHSDQFTSVNYGGIMYQKTGLVFFYLKDYLGEEKFNQAMSAYFEAWKFKHPQPEDMRKVLEETTGKNLSWLFDDLIQTTNHIDYKLKKVAMGKQGAMVRVKNVGQVAGPIEINVYSKGKLVETSWLEPGSTETTLKTPFGTIDQVIIDQSKDIPELNRNNNTWRAGSILHKIEPIKQEFLFSDNEADHNSLRWLPMLGGNVYDGFMLGASFHNLGVPFQKFSYVLTPMFGFYSKKPVGMAEFSYSMLPKKGLKIAHLGLSVKSFSRNSYAGEQFVAFNPYWSATIGNRKNRSNISQEILLKGLYGLKTSEFGNTEKGGFLQYGVQWNRPDHQLNVKVRAEYIDGQLIQLGRMSMTAKYNWRYMKNKMKRNLEVRAYFGANVYNHLTITPIDYLSERYNLSLSGGKGVQDLFYEEYNFARNDVSGFWSQQRMENFGNFKSTSSFGISSKWLGSMNVYFQLPIKPNLLGVFADYGAFSNGSSVETAYNAGLGVRLSNVLSVYFPLVRSTNMGSLWTNYGSEIRFSLKLNLVNNFNLSNLLK